MASQSMVRGYAPSVSVIENRSVWTHLFAGILPQNCGFKCKAVYMVWQLLTETVSRGVQGFQSLGLNWSWQDCTQTTVPKQLYLKQLLSIIHRYEMCQKGYISRSEADTATDNVRAIRRSLDTTPWPHVTTAMFWLYLHTNVLKLPVLKFPTFVRNAK
jgi:hypothetical protein